MKVIKKTVDHVYRFRCYTCNSELEMTEAEKWENDEKFNEGGAVYMHAFNPKDYFDCPVCGKVSTMRRKSIHRYTVYEDGTMMMEY